MGLQHAQTRHGFDWPVQAGETEEILLDLGNSVSRFQLAVSVDIMSNFWGIVNSGQECVFMDKATLLCIE